MRWNLPRNLPSGRLVAPGPQLPGRRVDPAEPVLWVSDDPVDDAQKRWVDLADAHPATGLWPLLLAPLYGEASRPWHDGELRPVAVADVDALDPDAVLSRLWYDSTEVVEGSEYDVVADLGLPSLDWPGLAPAGDPPVDPTTLAAFLASGAEGRWYLGLVPAGRGADALAVSGWSGPANHTDTADISAVVRSWEERFGARVVAVGFDTLYLTVAAPPGTYAEGLAVAVEHLAFCPDNITQSDFASLPAYARLLVDTDIWAFWWD